MKAKQGDTCACPNCTCKLGEHSVVRHGKHYCCEGCAKHHEHGEACVMAGCQCAKGTHS